MKSAAFFCRCCKTKTEASAEDYINADYWPANPAGGKYYFSSELLWFWYQLKHFCAGTSEKSSSISLKPFPKKMKGYEKFLLLLFDLNQIFCFIFACRSIK